MIKKGIYVPCANLRVLVSCMLIALILSFTAFGKAGSSKNKHEYLNFVYTSDAHYGIKRSSFRGAKNVDAQVVNLAMVHQINTVSDLTFPDDGGVKANSNVGGIDFLIESGDMANRMEPGTQSATMSWAQFIADYSSGLKLVDGAGKPTKLYLLPGNHDVSNAIGYYKTMTPATDAGSMAGIYNMMNIGTKKTAATYDYSTDKIHYSFEKEGIHFSFICMWPDSAERVWLDKDLSNVTKPVVLVTHDQPDIETKHLFNPNGAGTVNATDKFENMVSEKCKDGNTASVASTIEQRNFAGWIKNHPNVKAYFHGNDNANEFYTYTGPDNNISLNVFRVDSPMKGKVSGKEETKLSFQLVTIDVANMSMTVRECLWNSTPMSANNPVVFGASKTISLK